MTTQDAILAAFDALGCTVSLHVRSRDDGRDVALDADRPMIMASIFKPFVALELFAQAAEGRIDLAKRIRSRPETRVPGPTGLSTFHDEVELSLHDLARPMVTVSDNEATDLLTKKVGLANVNARFRALSCETTLLRSTLGDMLDDLGRELSFASYAQLLDAQEGRLGPEAQARGTDLARIDACAALDPARGSVTTALDMTKALAAIWEDTAAPRAACRDVRALMAAQITRRLEPAMPKGGRLAAKSGGLFGRVRNEIAMISHPDGKDYVVAILTRTRSGFGDTSAINIAMAESVRLAIETVRA